MQRRNDHRGKRAARTILLGALAGLAAGALAQAPRPGQAPVSATNPASARPASQNAGAQTIGELGGQERASVLARASAGLNRMLRVNGRFLQIAPDGSASTGRIWIEKPGRLRFEYDAPVSMAIIASDGVVGIFDLRLKTADKMPLSASPLQFVLRKDIDLDRDARVTRVVRQPEAVLVTVRDRDRKADGEITLVFTGADLNLTQWAVKDGSGQTTRIRLDGVLPGGPFDPKLFQVRDPRLNRPGGTKG